MINQNQIRIAAIAGIGPSHSNTIRNHIAKYLTEYLTEYCLTPDETSKVSVSVNITIKK